MMMKVKIKTWEAMEKQFGLDVYGDIQITESMCFNTTMENEMPSDRIIEVEAFDDRYSWKGWEIINDMIEVKHFDGTTPLTAEIKYPDVKSLVKSMSPFTDDPATRKKHPVYSGVINYFPDALAAVSRCSFEGNEQHNPGTPLHWDRSKSGDELDAMMRHVIDKDWAQVAWRALAQCQKDIEASWGEGE
jgi:hypothetical protein